MVEIAQKYDPPHRERYLKAAKEFRLPYLDYFRPRGGEVTFPGRRVGNSTRTSFPYDFRLPDIFNEKKIALKLAPRDTLTPDQDNPLYSFKFATKSGQLDQVDQQFLVSSSFRIFQYTCSIKID